MKKINGLGNLHKAVIIALAVVFALSLGNCAILGGLFDFSSSSSSSSNKGAAVTAEEYIAAKQAAEAEEYTAARRAAFPQSYTPDTGVIPYIIMRSGTVGYRLKKGDRDITVTDTIVLQNFIDAIRADANGANCTIQFGDGETPLTTSNDDVTFSGRWGTITLTGYFTSYVIKNTGAINISGAINVINYARLRHEGKEALNVTMINNTGTGTLTVEGGFISTNGKDPASAITNSSTGTIIVKNGLVEGSATSTGIGIRNTAAGKIIIDGGWVSEKGLGICNEGAGTVTINNGYSSVYNDGTGTVTVNGGTTRVLMQNGTGTINGGNIDGVALSFSSDRRNSPARSPVLTINGGLFRIFGSAIYIGPGGRIILSGNPEMNSNLPATSEYYQDNSIAIHRREGKSGTLSVSASFAPAADRRYFLEADISSPDGFLMVENGADFFDKFDFRGRNESANYKLGISGNNIVLQPK